MLLCNVFGKVSRRPFGEEKIIKKIALLLLGLVVTQSFFADAQWEFENVTSTVVDINPSITGNVFDYAFVDLNGDNYLDIITNNHNTFEDPMWLGTADHKFVYWQSLPMENKATSAFHLAELDYNGDGQTDLAYTGNEGGFMLNINISPVGTLKPLFDGKHKDLSSPETMFIDLDGDGTLETMMRPGLIFGDFAGDPIQEGVQYGSCGVADFNGDNWPDLFCAGTENSRGERAGPRKMLINNNGTLESVALDQAFFNDNIDGVVRTADFNNDGHMDIYIWNDYVIAEGKPSSNRRVRLYLGDGNLGFTDVTEI